MGLGIASPSAPSLPALFLLSDPFFTSDLYLCFSHSIATQLGSAMRPWGQKSFGACSPRCVTGEGGLVWTGQWAGP